MSHIQERGISPGTAAKKGYQGKRKPEKKSKLSWLVYPDKLKSEMRSEIVSAHTSLHTALDFGVLEPVKSKGN